MREGKDYGTDAFSQDFFSSVPLRAASCVGHVHAQEG